MAFCDKTKKYTDQPVQFDTLGPASTGGAAQRSRIFGNLNALSPALQQNADAYASAARAAASNPGWGEATDLARRTMRGDYLNGSPALDKYVNSIFSRSMAESADQDARLQSQYARAGLNFSTANQQASQANRTAAAAQAGATATQAALQNYLSERAYQNQAPDTLAKAESAPLQYLGSINEQYLTPQATQADIVNKLTAGGPVATPSTAIYREPGVWSSIWNQGVGSITGNC